MREGRAIFLKALLTSIMVILMVLFAIIIGFGPPALIATLGALTNIDSVIMIANVLLVVGIFVALFLSIKWTVYYLMAPLLTIFDGLPGKTALEHSRKLIQGRFWHVLARVAVPKLVFVIFGVLAMSLIGYVADVVLNVPSSVNLDVRLRIGSMIDTLIPIIIAALLNPLIIISDLLLLRSLRE